MFKLPKEAVVRMLGCKTPKKIAGLDIPFDEDNEIAKGYHFEDQARVNLELERNYSDVCSASEQECKRNSCILFARKSGKILNGWVCREYAVDFPKAPFDSRYHVSRVGTDKPDIAKSIKNMEELMQKGAKYICTGCYKVYASKPKTVYEDGHGGRMMEICRCRSDLFTGIDEFIKTIGGGA